MVRESEYAESNADFIHKLVIAQKGINKSLYWIEFLHETQYITQTEFENIHIYAVELVNIITTIIKKHENCCTKYENFTLYHFRTNYISLRDMHYRMSFIYIKFFIHQ